MISCMLKDLKGLQPTVSVDLLFGFEHFRGQNVLGKSIKSFRGCRKPEISK